MDYIKNNIVASTELKVNGVIVFGLTLVYFMLTLSNVHITNWIYVIGSIFLSGFVCLISIYMTRIIKINEEKELEYIKIKETFYKLLSDLAYKNYVLMREYDEICDFHYDEIVKECYDDALEVEPTFVVESNVKTLITNKVRGDNGNKISSYKWMDKSIHKIYACLRLCDYFTNVKKSDSFKIVDNKIYCNISFDSISNKKNRIFESLTNQLSKTDMLEVCKTWELVNIHSQGNDTYYTELISLPCKWILYEYRNIFKRLNSVKYFDKINSTFKGDYFNFELIVLQIKNNLDSIHKYNDKNNVIDATNNIYIKYLDMYMYINFFLIDNFIAINIVDLFNASFLGCIFSIFIGGCLYVAYHLIYDHVKKINNNSYITDIKFNDILNSANLINVTCANKRFK